MIDVIKIDVPAFLRILELAKEDVDNDMDLHDITEKVIEISQERTVTMGDYDDIVEFMKSQGNDSSEKKPDELDDIKRLGGISSGKY